MIWGIIIVMIWIAVAAKWASDSHKRRFDDAKRAEMALTKSVTLDDVLHDIYNR